MPHRLSSQYTSSPKLVAMLHALTAFSQEIGQTLYKMLEQTHINTATGPSLDTLGIILGANRHVPTLLPIRYFGFDDTPRVLGFDTGLFYEEGASLKGVGNLPDETYRRLLRARIICNTMHGTCEDLIALMQHMLPPTIPFYIEDLGCGAASVVFPVSLPENVVALLQGVNFLPRILGARLTLGPHFTPTHVFGFTDTPHAKGFGDEKEPGKHGGPFAENLTLYLKGKNV